MQTVIPNTTIRPSWKEWLLFYLVWSFLSLVLTAIPLTVVLLADPITADILLPGYALELPRIAVHFLGIAALGGMGFAALGALYLVENVGLLVASLCRMPSRSAWRTLLAGLVLVIAIQAAWHLVELKMGKDRTDWVPPASEQQRTIASLTGMGEGGLAEKVILLIVAGLFLPVAEEMIFRGALFGGMRQRFGFLTSALCSSALFGVVHLGLALPAGMMGLVFAWVMERERSLYLPISLHALNNTVVIMVTLQTGW